MVRVHAEVIVVVSELVGQIEFSQGDGTNTYLLTPL